MTTPHPLSRADIEIAIEMCLDKSPKTSPTAVCELLVTMGYPAMRGSRSGEWMKPVAEYFERVCEVAARSSRFVYRIHGNARSIRLAEVAS